MHNFTAVSLEEALAMEPNKIFVYYNSATDRLDNPSFKEGSSRPCEAEPFKAAAPLVGDADQIQVDNTCELVTRDHIELYSDKTGTAQTSVTI